MKRRALTSVFGTLVTLTVALAPADSLAVLDRPRALQELLHPLWTGRAGRVP